MTPSDLLTPELRKELIDFTQTLIRIKSISGQYSRTSYGIHNVKKN